jgi:hypothetical protein
MGAFVNEHPSIQIIDLLILIGMMLVGENAHLSNALILGSHVTQFQGYLYFAISFSLFEVLNMKASKRTSNTK